MGSFQSARFEDVGTDYTPEKRPLNIFLLRLAFSNVYLCDGVLIDSGTILDFNSIRRAVEAFQDDGVKAGALPLTSHVITHAHPDHQGSSSRVCSHFGVPYLCGEHDRDVAEGRKRMCVGPSYHPMNYLPHSLWSGRPHPIDSTLREGDRIGASKRIEVIETPGHTRGSISFWIPDSRVAIIGDVLANSHWATIHGHHYPSCPREPPRRFSQSRITNRESLQKILSLGPHIICFGHGPPLVLLNGPLEMGEEDAAVEGVAVGQ